MLGKLLIALSATAPALAQKAGSFVEAGSTQVSAMMMFLGNEEKVYILDKSEGNAAQINGHPAWASVWDINTHQTELMEIYTNSFCASGMHLPNGSFVTFGGNSAVGVGGATSTDGGIHDTAYGAYDGRKAIRVINPCTSSDDFSSTNCQWYDNPSVLSMQKMRWYSAAEALPNGTVAMIGGFTSGGYVNRNTPNDDPAYEGGGAEPTYEFYPSNGQTPQVLDFMVKTSGLNSYAHSYLMPSGKMLLQANHSTTLWDYETNEETPLPDMPNNVVRVYPASGAAAMMPLTPENNWTPTILFCGGSDMPDEYYGNYSWPHYNTWTHPASKDCQQLTPEPQDGSTPKYVQDDSLPQGRTMGQFITLPDGTMLVINGGANGTAGYANRTLYTETLDEMPFYQSLASDPVGQPAIYNPKAPAGQRWSTAGLGSSSIARLYHSTAILLPDASVLIAGSNPNIDVQTDGVPYPTQYTAEIFYPPYFSASVRPSVSGAPTTLTYGGKAFDLTVAKGSYAGGANAAAANTTVVLARGGFTTHAYNMGQRHLQLNSTYSVNADGSFVLHVAQVPPNPALLTPGPALLFTVVNGIPSNGTMVLVGNGQIATQPTEAVAALPASQTSSNGGSSSGGGSGNDNGSASSAAMAGGAVVASAMGIVAFLTFL
ncbi:hypothetical protein CONPUDRAFT_89269 [Coniophora puteana RWD-64-598 SS2]|uniref:Glyoxal oxidase n=1 Tax=Coniophora puteana (strain RWD-64-598) TaxID=741705 RepID=A0A5M3MWN4_CONPW|nr:uncharacterized protein CONPUDRAFT_89269 [Coniophora puteana RWD-64-598 SS2]EIW83558.1 hypothetical protein CONPUDRAFT_89269 [Coniophora puteana RWD-64-598 SS2]